MNILKLIDWINPEFVRLYNSPPDEGAGGDDLADALAAAGDAKGKIKFAGLSEEGEGESEEAHEEEEHEEEENEKQPKSAIMSTFEDHVNSDDDDEGEDEEASDDEDESESDDEEDDLEEKYPELDDEIQGSPSIKEKFKRLNTQRREMLAELRKERRERQEAIKAAQSQSTEKIDPTETEEYKALKEERDSLNGIVEKIAIQHSKPFQDKFDNRIDAEMKRAGAFVKAIDDKDTMQKVAAGLDALVALAPGEDNDPMFYKRLNQVTKMMEDSGDIVKARMQSIRELVNERAATLSNMEDAKGGFALMEQQQLEARTKEAIDLLDAMKVHFEKENADRIKLYRDNEEDFHYDKITGPLLAMAKDELEATLKHGSVTPKLSALIYNGTQYSHAMLQLQELWKVAEKLQEENDKLTGKSKRKKKAGRPGSSVRKKTSSDDFDPSKGGAIVATMRKLESAGKIGS